MIRILKSMIYSWISFLTWKIPLKKENSWRFSVQLLLVRVVAQPEIPFPKTNAEKARRLDKGSHLPVEL